MFDASRSRAEQRRNGERWGTPTDRRRVLRGIGAAGLIGVAGCLHDTDSSETSRGERNEGEPLRVGVGNDFAQPNFNRFNPSKDQRQTARWLFVQPLYYSLEAADFLPGIIEEWEFDGETATFHIDDRFQWHSGEPVTARDFVVQYGLEKHFGHGAWNNIDRQEAVDETTWRLHFSGPVNETITLLSLFGFDYRLQKPRMVFGEYYEALEAGEDDAESNLLNFRWEEPVGTGPWEFDAYVGQNEMVATWFDDYFLADDIAIPRVVFRVGGSDATVINDMTSDRIDYRWSVGGASTWNSVTERSDTWEARRNPSDEGRAWIFDNGHDWWGNRHVRRGLAYLWNEEEFIAATPDAAENEVVPAEPETFLMDDMVDRYLDDLELEDYAPGETLEDEAAAAFERAGWSRQGGTWHDENDEEVTFEITVGADHTKMLDRMQVMEQVNEDFGLTSEVRATDNEAYWARWRDGDHDIQWGTIMGVHPATRFRRIILGPIGQDQYGYPTEVTVPELGDVGGEPTETFDVLALEEDLATAQSVEEEREAVRKLAWICNQTVPGRQNYQDEASLTAVNTRRFDWPGDDEFHVGQYEAIWGDIEPRST